MEKFRKKIDAFYSQKMYEQAHDYMINELTSAIQNDKPIIILNLLCELMSYYRVHGKFQEGNVMANKTVAIINMLNLQNSLLAGTAYLNIATLYRLEGLYDDSLNAFNTCQKIYEENLEETDFQYIAFYNNLSLLYQDIGENENAIKFSQKALGLIEKMENAQIEIAITNTNLSLMYFDLDKREQGLACLEKAIQLFEQFGKNDPHYFAALSSLAQNYFINKEYDKSIDLYQKVLEKIKGNFGENKDYKTVHQNYLYVLEQNKNKNFGINLCKEYYYEIAQPIIKEKFPELLPYMAVGLVGMGSECLGFDDELSQDHDFGPAFCIWLPNEQYKIYGKKLQNLYDNLPKEYKGFKRIESANGQGRVGVFELEKFYLNYLKTIPQNYDQWAQLDEQSLLMMTSGEVFFDNFGDFTKIREHLSSYFPEKLRIEKLLQAVALMSQSGQYNYNRCAKRNDIVAKNLCLNEFVQNAISCYYLLNKKYQPYYKWAFKGMSNLQILANKVHLIKKLYQTTNDDEIINIIEDTCKAIVVELKKQNLTELNNTFLQEHIAYLQNKISQL